MENWFVVILAISIYLLPTVIAFMRGHASRWAIFMLNLALGWTVAIWFWCIIWALANAHRPSQIIINNHNGVN